MAGVFNEGLQATDFKYFIAAGKSAAQLTRYFADARAFTESTRAFVERHRGGMAALFNKRLQLEVTGLLPGDGSSSAPQTPTFHAQADQAHLILRHPHLYLGAMPRREEEGRFLVPVVRSTLAGVIIASPVIDGTAFTPAGAQEISLPRYADLTRQPRAAIKSPAIDEAFQNPYLNGYPFKPGVPAGAAPVIS